VRGKKYITRLDGTKVSFNQNAMVSVNEKGLPLGTRLFGPNYKELRENHNSKLISLAKFIL
jgi:large subunit ribosomal protein L14